MYFMLAPFIVSVIISGLLISKFQFLPSSSLTIDPVNSNWDNRKVLTAAAQGKLEYVKAEFERVGNVIVKTADINGWLPLHEASRTGSLEVVSYLVEVGGADINALTKNQLTAEVIARDFLGEDSEMVKLLVALGAKEL